MIDAHDSVRREAGAVVRDVVRGESIQAVTLKVGERAQAQARPLSVAAVEGVRQPPGSAYRELSLPTRCEAPEVSAGLVAREVKPPARVSGGDGGHGGSSRALEGDRVGQLHVCRHVAREQRLDAYSFGDAHVSHHQLLRAAGGQGAR